MISTATVTMRGVVVWAGSYAQERCGFQPLGHSAKNTLIGIKFVVLIFAANQHLTEVKRGS